MLPKHIQFYCYFCLLLAFTLAPASVNNIKHVKRVFAVFLEELHNIINGEYPSAI